MSKKIFSVKSVIFDMDGVITHTMPDHHRAWKEVLFRYGVDVTYEDIYTREGQPGDEALVEILEKYRVGYPPAELANILREKEEHFKKHVRVRYIPNTRTLLKRLHKQQLKLGLVTGTAKHELHKILPNHIYDLFSVVITGDDVSVGKPNPEPFLKALEQLKILANDALVIENAPYGIESAKSAGITCLALETSLSREYLLQADHVFRSINDLTNKITIQAKR